MFPDFWIEVDSGFHKFQYDSTLQHHLRSLLAMMQGGLHHFATTEILLILSLYEVE